MSGTVMPDHYDLIVIGAGAAGLTAAAHAGKSGKSVLVVDKNTQPARKVFISGGGKCNFSNKFVSALHYVSDNPHFCKSALAGLSFQEVTQELDRAGIKWEEREDGKLFAFSGAEIRQFLLDRARRAGAVFLFGIPEFDLQKENCFRLACAAGTFLSENVLIASGGISYPAAGATDIGYRLAGQFGLKVIRPEPALVSLDFEREMRPDFSGLNGISLPVQIKTGKKIMRGSLLFTHGGISGPAVLQTSLYHENGRPVEIDFLPQTDLAAVLKSRRAAGEKKRIFAVLSDYLPARLVERFADLLPAESRTIPLSGVSDKSFSLLDDKIKRCRFVPPRTGGWAKAEVTRGGVDVNALFSATMECRTVPGLYFAGEVVDVIGELGGFNLHWAWASGKAAGKATAEKAPV